MTQTREMCRSLENETWSESGENRLSDCVNPFTGVKPVTCTSPRLQNIVTVPPSSGNTRVCPGPLGARTHSGVGESDGGAGGGEDGDGDGEREGDGDGVGEGAARRSSAAESGADRSGPAESSTDRIPQ